MKKIFTILVMVAVLCCSALVWAEEAEKKEEKAFTISGELGIFAPHVSEYTGEKISNSVVAQPSATLTHNSTGIYISAIGYILRNGVDEAAVYLGKSTSLGDWVFDTGIGFDAVEKMGTVDGDFFVVYTGVDFPEAIGIIPFAYIEADIPFHREYAEGGVLWKVGARNEKPFEIVKQPLDLKIEAGGNDGAYETDSRVVSFIRGTVSTVAVEAGGISFSPSFTLQKGFGGIAGQAWRAIAGLTFSF